MVESAIARKTNGKLQKKMLTLKVSSNWTHFFPDENENQIRCEQFVCVLNTQKKCAELKFIFNLFNAWNGCAQREHMYLLLKYFCCESSNLTQIFEHSLIPTHSLSQWYCLMSKLHKLMNFSFKRAMCINWINQIMLQFVIFFSFSLAF